MCTAAVFVARRGSSVKSVTMERSSTLLRIFQQAVQNLLSYNSIPEYVTCGNGPDRANFCQALCLCLCLCIRFPDVLENIFTLWFPTFISTHFASFIQNDITKLQKKHSLDLSYLVTKSIQLHFLNKDGGGRILCSSQDQVIGYGNHSLKRKTQELDG